MLSSLTELDVDLRHALFVLATSVLVLWTWNVVGPAATDWPRLRRALSMFFLCFVVCFLFDLQSSTECMSAAHAIMNTVLMTQWKARRLLLFLSFLPIRFWDFAWIVDRWWLRTHKANMRVSFTFEKQWIEESWDFTRVGVVRFVINVVVMWPLTKPLTNRCLWSRT